MNLLEVPGISRSLFQAHGQEAEHEEEERRIGEVVQQQAGSTINRVVYHLARKRPSPCCRC